METRRSIFDDMPWFLKEQTFENVRKTLKKRPFQRELERNLILVQPGRLIDILLFHPFCISNSMKTAPSTAGYSGTPLIQKLGIKPGSALIQINAPPHYADLLGKMPVGTKFAKRISRGCAFVHFFTTDRRELETRLKQLRSNLADTGTLWVSWPKKSAGIKTSVTEDVIRATALPLGFVDTKVCAVDQTWSGLKLMIRRENRKAKAKQ
jgi:hypothetical protein